MSVSGQHGVIQMYAYAKLTPKQSKFVDEQIEAGVYSNPSEVIRAAVREIMKVYK